MTDCRPTVLVLTTGGERNLATWSTILRSLRHEDRPLRIVAIDAAPDYGQPFERETLAACFDEVLSLPKARESRLAEPGSDATEQDVDASLFERWVRQYAPAAVGVAGSIDRTVRCLADAAAAWNRTPVLWLQDDPRSLANLTAPDTLLPVTRSLVWGERAYQAALQGGLSPKDVLLTGDPWMEVLHRGLARRDRATARSAMGIPEAARFFVLAADSLPTDPDSLVPLIKSQVGAFKKLNESFGTFHLALKAGAPTHERLDAADLPRVFVGKPWLAYSPHVAWSDLLAACDGLLDPTGAMTPTATQLGVPVGLPVTPDAPVPAFLQALADEGQAVLLPDKKAVVRFGRKAAPLDEAHRRRSRHDLAPVERPANRVAAEIRLQAERTAERRREQRTILAFQPAMQGMSVHPFYGGKDVTSFRVGRAVVDRGWSLFIFPSDGENHFDIALYQLGPDGSHATVLPTCLYPTEDTVRLAAERNGASPPEDGAAWAEAVTAYVRDRSQAAWSAVNRCRPDLIHVHYTHLKDPVLPAVREAFPGIPIVLTHYSEGEGAWLDRYDHVVCLSHVQQRDLVATRPELAGKTSVIHPDVPEAFLAPLDPPTDGPLLYAGTMRSGAPERKGLPLLLEAWRRNRDRLSSLSLTVVGDGPDLQDWRDYAERYQLPVTFTGWLAPEDLAREMARARLFVMPSRGEGLAYVYLEALCMGLPVIGYPPNVEELNACVAPDCARAFDAVSGQADELAETLLAAAGDAAFLDPDRRVAFAGRARQLFAPGSTARKYLALYDRLLAEGAQAENPDG